MKLFYSLQYGRRPFHVAVEKGHTDAIDILLKHCADANTKERVTTL